jgi:aspartyl-tRNA(Asn)/glutamyl-tRNA(Gln) amidotransferase subunit A
MHFMNSYTTFRSKLQTNATSCVQAVEEFLNTIESKQNLNAMLTVNADEARADAAAADKRFADGTARPLEGMVVALKDNINTKGLRTSCGSKILEGYIPIYNATVVERMKAAGAIIIGKANMDEFAMGSSNENSAYGAVRNPINPEYVPGGSSGGSATTVAAGFCHAALGSDTGGSVRLPASFCGVVGLKPTYGRVSRYGLVAYGSSLDQIGPLAPTVADAALLFDAINGNDERDATSCPFSPLATTAQLAAPLPDSFTVATLPDEQLQGCDADVMAAYRRTIEALHGMGAKIVTHEMKYINALIPTYYIIATAEASSNLSRYDGVRYGFRAQTPAGHEDEMTALSRSQGFGAEVKRRIMLGTYVLSSGYYDAYYTKALKVRRLIYNDYKEMFKTADLFVLPSYPTPPFKLGEKSSDPLAMYLGDIFTVSANLGGVPGISIPAGTAANGLPIGVQLQANHFDEMRLMQFAHHLEQNLKASL